MNKVYIALDDALKHLDKIKSEFTPLHRLVIDAVKYSLTNNVSSVQFDKEGLEEHVADFRNRLHLIWALGADYDGYNDTEHLKQLIDELVSYTQLPVEDVPDITGWRNKHE